MFARQSAVQSIIIHKKGKGHFGERVIIHHVIAIIDLPVKSHNNTTTQSTSVKQSSYVKAKTYCACRVYVDRGKTESKNHLGSTRLVLEKNLTTAQGCQQD